MKIFFLLSMFFYSCAYSEDFNLICEGERKVHNLSGKEFNVTDFESVLLKINNNSMEYIGVNSGRSYFFSRSGIFGSQKTTSRRYQDYRAL